VTGEAGDGVEAIERARQLKPDVMILDVDMPRLNGLDAIPQIREASPNTKIVVLTLHESREMLRRAVGMGAHGYVLKSDLAAGLLTAVKEVSQGKLSFTPKMSAITTGECFQGESGAKFGIKPSPRQAEIIRRLAAGKTNKEVAAGLGISVRTVEMHRARIMRKFGLHSFAELIHYALSHGSAIPNL
jgi:DNA-binding NarL/FixJ family response regulator